MATLTGKLVADTYKALLKMIDNDVVTATEKQISDGLGGGTGIFIDQDGEIRASKYRVTAGTSSQFLKADGSLDSTSYLTKAIADGFYLQIGTTTTSIPEGSNLYFTNSRVLNTTLNGFTAVSGTVTSADSVLTAIEKIWWNIVNGGGGGGGGYVPYVGATQNLNLGEYGLLGGFVQFDTTPTTAPNAVGALSWNDQDGTLDLKLKGGNVTLQIGQEQVTRVVNKTGVNLLESNYQAVRISGAQGNRLKVALAQANNDANSAETLGLVTENINDNNEGFITSSGLVRDINTTGSLQGETWADGDILYLSGTTAGRVTNIKPQAPIHTVIIGFVVRAHATQGAIYVKVDNGYELDELHNVKIIAPEDKDFLVYDGTNLYWENRSIYGTEGYLPIYNDTNIFNDSIIYSDGVGIGVGTNILEPTAIATFFGNVDLVTGTYLTSDGFNLIGRGNLINQIEIGSQNASDYLTFIAGNAERARITAAGNFGIGLTNPSASLHIKGSTYTNVIVDNNSATGGGSYLSYQNGTNKALFGLSGAFELNTGSDVAIASTIAGGGIKFYTNNSTTQAMGIVSSGNAYLGQAPTFLGLGTEFIVRGQASDGVLGVMDSTEAVKGLFVSNSSLSWLGTYSNHPLAFRTNNTEWARISSAGNLLIGTIVDNTTDKLQVNGTSYFADNIVLADSKGIVSSGVNMLSRNNLNNQIIIGADGGINDNVAFYSGDLERMRLLSNGRLAINKTTASYQVDVQGDVNVSGAFRVNGTIIPNGTVTSVAMSVPTGLVISGSPITSSGTLAVTYAVNYGIPTLTKQSDWDDAYTWVTNFPDQSSNAGKFLTTNGSVLSWASLVTGVSSVFGRTGAVVAQSGDYTTAQVTESGNLYYTDARARASLSFVAGSGAYNSTTGVITIPTNTNQLTNGASFITLASLSASAPLSYNNGTGAFSISQASGSTNGFLSSTDWNTFNNKQNALGYTPVPTTRTLTINGTSYDLSADRSWTIASGIGGSGTTNYLPKFTGSTSIGNSLIFDNGTSVAINTSIPFFNSKLQVNQGTTGGIISNFYDSASDQMLYSYATNSGSIGFQAHNSAGLVVKNIFFNPSGGNVGIGITNPDEILTLNRASSLYARIVNTSNSVSTYWGVNGTEIYFGSSSNSPVTFYSNSTERMRINAGGQLLVGLTSGYSNGVTIKGASDDYSLTLAQSNASNAGWGQWADTGGNYKLSRYGGGAYSSPALTITLTGAATFSSSVSLNGDLIIRKSGTQYGTIYASAGNDLFIESVNSAAIYYNSVASLHQWRNNGSNVMTLNSTGLGIGTTSPSNKLHIWQGAGQFTGFPSSGSPFTFLQADYNASFLRTTFTLYNPTNGYDGDLGIGLTNSSNVSYTAMYLKGSTGNVGIGTTTSISSKLVVNGNIASGYNWGISGSTFNIITDANGTNGVTLSTSYWSDGYGPVKFNTGDTERMRITSGGQIYMGNSAGDGYRLQIFGTNQAGSTFGQTYIGVAAYSQWVNSSGAFVMGLDGASGTTERMRINAGGNVSIGNTNNTYKLDVSGTIRGLGSIIDGANNGNTSRLNFTRTDFSWGIYNETNLRIYTGSGNTLSPSTQVFELATNGAATFSSSVTATQGIFSNTSGNQLRIAYDSFYHWTLSRVAADGRLAFVDSQNGEKLTILAGGNVGIGTTSPECTLDLNGIAFIRSDLRFGSSFNGASNNTAIIKWQGSGASIPNSLGIFTWADGRDIQIGGNNVLFRTEAGTERMRITSGGNVGIGTTSPSQKLTLSNTDADVLIDFVRNGTNRGTIGHKFVSGVQNELGITANYPTTIGFYTNGARRLYIDPFGKVGVNTTSFATSDYFKVEGQTSINGDLILHSSTQLGYGLSLPNASNTGEAVAKTWVVYSDARVKKNVSELNYGIDSIKKLKPISYNHHNSEFQNGEINILEKYKYEIGFIAQEVYDVIPEVVNPGNDTQLWTMNYERLTSVIVKGMQEQQVMIETNAEKIARLEKRVLQLESKNA